MKKRQIKKNLKKHVKLYAFDESVFLSYTKDEFLEAQEVRQREAIRIAKMGYKRIKSLGIINFLYPAPKKRHEFMSGLTQRLRKSTVSPYIAVQSMKDFHTGV